MDCSCVVSGDLQVSSDANFLPSGDGQEEGHIQTDDDDLRVAEWIDETMC